MTRKEAAEMLQKKVSWLRYAERRRLLPYVKVGQQVRYDPADLTRWIDSRRVDEAQSAKCNPVAHE
jgi:hypothetical protein